MNSDSGKGRLIQLSKKERKKWAHSRERRKEVPINGLLRMSSVWNAKKTTEKIRQTENFAHWNRHQRSAISDTWNFLKRFVITSESSRGYLLLSRSLFSGAFMPPQKTKPLACPQSRKSLIVLTQLVHLRHGLLGFISLHAAIIIWLLKR